MTSLSANCCAPEGGRRLWPCCRTSTPVRLVGAAWSDKEMFDGAGVVTKHTSVADPESAALEHDDVAGFERFSGLLDRLAAAGDTEIGPLGGQFLDHPVDALFEI